MTPHVAMSSLPTRSPYLPSFEGRWQSLPAAVWGLLLLLGLLSGQAQADTPDPTVDLPVAQEFVWPGSNRHVRPGESVDDLTVFFGNATVDGRVRGHLAVIGGQATVNGTVDGGVGGAGSTLTLGSNAIVRGNLEGFGRLDRQAGSQVLGKAAWNEDVAWPDLLRRPYQWICQLDPDSRLFLREHVFKARPLSLSLAWPWWVLGVLAVPNLLALLLFRRSLRRAARLAEERPLGTLLLGLISVPLLLPVVVLAGVATGGLGVPFLLLALALGALVGKVAVTVQLGRSLLPARPSLGPTSHRDAAASDPLWIPFLLGSAVLVVAYLTPFVGLGVWLLLGVWGMGLALRLLFARNPGPTPTPTVARPTTSVPAPGTDPAATPAPPPPPPPAARILDPVITPSTTTADPVASSDGTTIHPTMNPSLPLSAAPIPGGPDVATTPDAGPSAVHLLTLPRAGLRPRLLALLVDILACAAFRAVMVPHWLDAWITEVPFLGVGLLVAYFAGSWVWRGATLGGLICGLRIIRLDARPIDWPIAIVRSLTSFLSLFSGGVGQFWCAWDPEQQSWQDKLAGTVVVREGRSRPLL